MADQDSPASREGYRRGLADALTGCISFIDANTPRAHQLAAGWLAGWTRGRELARRHLEREAEAELEAGL